MTEPPGLIAFNALSDARAVDLLVQCCSSTVWAQRMAAGRPFPSADALYTAAENVLGDLRESEIDAALAGHPRIGDRADNPSSAREQSAVAAADDDVRARLRAGNEEYEQKFGHVYLVCASGRSAHELLGVLRDRLGNDSVTERKILRTELAAINRIRLERLLGEIGDTAH
ncbi:2-oxo-4-hydroxy-4-carboxy-5-ureidoimidazoline decarboxylase [Rhodococcus opacus]|uniref:2-oxo-4-hydroxy-4-carboxy-5-ureidoimidazoline decarboxylase n=1 Tax=Rhodococcus TaxID=1827 RepID=UPI0002A41BCF|nr:MULTISPECIES: 2-oxo-4-hydroxy-4-carboxy-5-ureidoimidazoline decarboxylase [Rhodococcus]ELB90030.1 OHCU decarboxylase [Rhodococcus wratislaviensis IFP 2016]MDX5968995.1 2-oxo-4-hydroxy-4-carboxy-5-ureidoimidazoline decarboxylase [Rhodococcus opacus]NKY72141.1 2-oxo-4-hydroxy-4-carboxy-5-ureidoimidazoline decarboxylase [Rhodococcus opacus]QDQ90166.1 2-oxo-4-hydroxy-4-carboxy-5-ureidoimidazoline decarboxylase [Rhodococcus sp. WB9]CAG7591270.1 Uric acid degradation bifunctional protein [Rhodoco